MVYCGANNRSLAKYVIMFKNLNKVKLENKYPKVVVVHSGSPTGSLTEYICVV